MRRMTVVSLLLNVVVLIPIVTALLLNAGWIERAYGGPTPARGILLSVYLAIWVVSILLLFRRNSGMIGSLLIVQILYKVTTPLTVGTLTNPVVISNLVIAAVHLVTVVLMFRGRHLDPGRW